MLRCLGEEDKVNAGKRKVVVLNGEEGLESEVHVDGIHLEHVLEFQYLRCVLDESSTDGAECIRKVASGRRVAGVIRSIVNARDCSFSVLEYCMKHCLCLFLYMTENVIEGKGKI